MAIACTVFTVLCVAPLALRVVSRFMFLVSAFVLGHDYPLLYVLRSVFGVSLYVLGVCCLL